MIAVDTSALIAVVLLEPAAKACAAALQDDDEVLMSSVTLAEALIVASGRNVGEQLMRLVEDLDIEAVPVTLATAQRIERIYRKWGKGIHQASLNLGDCFSYDVAKEHGCRLLYVGNDFSKTDIESVL